MKKIVFNLLFGLLQVSSFVQAADINTAVTSPRPNVLFITIDDLNNDLGTYGHKLVKSPNIDALATKGIRFDKAYSQAPMCTPSRASFMTGLYPDQTGIIAHGSHTRMTAHFRDHIPKVTTLPQLFKNNGYFSGRIGKIYHQGVPHQIGTAGADDAASWHETINPIGIDKQVEGQILAFNEQALKRQSFGGVLSFLAVGDDDKAHTDGKVASAAIEMMKAHHPEKTNKPFFIGVGFYRPHTPFVAPKKYFDLYPLNSINPYIAPKNDRNDIPEIALHDRTGQLGLTLSQRKQIIQGYYAAVSYVDAQVGRVLSALEQQGLSDNTIVVLLSDHGYELGQHGLWQKGSLFEGSARTPLIIYAPKAKGNGRAITNPVELVDLYPTLATLAQLTVPDYLAGIDLTPALNDVDFKIRKGAYSAILNRTKGSNNQFAFTKVRGHSIRTNRYRYTEWGDGLFGAELYDHLTDPQELKNLADKVPFEGIRIKMKWLLDDAIAKAQTRITAIE